MSNNLKLELLLANPTKITDKDLEGLPNDLLEQLSLSKNDKIRSLILTGLKEFKGMACLDKLIIYIYKSSGIVCKRGYMTSTLHKMKKDGLIESVKGMSGVYRLLTPSVKVSE